MAGRTAGHTPFQQLAGLKTMASVGNTVTVENYYVIFIRCIPNVSFCVHSKIVTNSNYGVYESLIIREAEEDYVARARERAHTHTHTFTHTHNLYTHTHTHTYYRTQTH